MRTPLESGQNCSKSNFHKMIYIGCCNDFGAGPGSPLGQGDFFSRCIFLDQVTAMKLYLSFSFSLFFPCIFLLVLFSLSPFLFISFSFFPLSRCMPLSAFLPFFILFFSVIQKPPEDLLKRWASSLFVNKDNLFWIHCISVAAFLPPVILFAVSEARAAKILSIRTRRKCFLVNWGEVRARTSVA